MRIAIISQQYTVGGGEIVSFRLAEKLSSEGRDVTYITGNPDMGEDRLSADVVRFHQNKIKRFVSRYMVKSSLLYFHIGHRILTGEIDEILKKLHPDIINIHGLSSVHYSVSFIEKCLEFAPVVWTLHDMISFTGQCGHAYDCTQFQNGCGISCPDLHIPLLIPRSYTLKIYQSRKNLFEKSQNLYAVAPSQWLADKALLGMWRDHKLVVIPNGLPMDVYRPTQKSDAKRKLNISPQDTVLMMSAANINKKGKGSDILVRALEEISHPLIILTMGNGTLHLNNPAITVIPCGYVRDEEKKALLFSAADIFIHPSRAETFGLVILEALACNTPVIAFPVGAVPDLVIPHKTGWLSSISAEGLAQTINQAISDIKQKDYNFDCRKFVDTTYDLGLQAERYYQYFSELSGLP